MRHRRRFIWRFSQDDPWMDDGVTGGSKAEVERMKGARMGPGSYSGTLGQVLNLGKAEDESCSYYL